MVDSNDEPQDLLFCAFNLEDLEPWDRPMRSIDRFLDFTGLREYLAPYYSHTGPDRRSPRS